MCVIFLICRLEKEKSELVVCLFFLFEFFSMSIIVFGICT